MGITKPDCPNYDPWRDQGVQTDECVYYCYWDGTCRFDPHNVKACPWTDLWNGKIKIIEDDGYPD